jgi:hypothetical protein
VLRGYKVIYRESQNKSTPSQVYQVINPAAKTAIVSGLAQSIEFRFQVLAFTVKDGPLSNSLLGAAQPFGKMIF